MLCERESVSPIVSAAGHRSARLATASAVCRRLIDAVRRSLRMDGLPTVRAHSWSTVCTVTVSQGTLIRELVGKLDHHVEMQAQLRNALNSVRSKYPPCRKYSRRLLCGTSWPQQHSVVRPQAHYDAAQPCGYSCVLYRRIGTTVTNRAGKPLPQLLFVCLHNRKTWTRC